MARETVVVREYRDAREYRRDARKMERRGYEVVDVTSHGEHPRLAKAGYAVGRLLTLDRGLDRRPAAPEVPSSLCFVVTARVACHSHPASHRRICRWISHGSASFPKNRRPAISITEYQVLAVT
jgi:hypothetical protein